LSFLCLLVKHTSPRFLVIAQRTSLFPATQVKERRVISLDIGKVESILLHRFQKPEQGHLLEIVRRLGLLDMLGLGWDSGGRLVVDRLRRGSNARFLILGVLFNSLLRCLGCDR
jgi:hypothetical protein